jgi:hypothetical protein
MMRVDHEKGRPEKLRPQINVYRLTFNGDPLEFSSRNESERFDFT